MLVTCWQDVSNYVPLTTFHLSPNIDGSGFSLLHATGLQLEKLFTTQGIVLLTGDKSIVGLVPFGCTLNRATKVQIHSILQIIAVLGYIIGFAAIYQNKVNQEKDHFTTYHSCMLHQHNTFDILGFGVASLITGLFANLVLGFVLYFSNASKPLLEKLGVKALQVKKFHRPASLARFGDSFSLFNLEALLWAWWPFSWLCGRQVGPA
jgi:hypothetical protein